jgi:hypothetical protein
MRSAEVKLLSALTCLIAGIVVPTSVAVVAEPPVAANSNSKGIAAKYCDDLGIASDANVRSRGQTTLHIDNSTIVPNIVAHENATIYIKDSTVEDDVHAVGNSTIHLVSPEVKGDVVSDPSATVHRSRNIAPPAKKRAFRMGLTPFPHDLTLDGVNAAKRFVRDNADVISVHIEGVPWLEAHTGEDIHPKLMEDWQRHRDAKPPDGKVYLSLSPLNNGRSGIAGYRAERENLPLPEPFVGKALDDPVVVKAYLEYCRRAIRYFEPDYLTIGIEVNELFHNNRSEWRAYTRLHRQVYEALNRENPALPICVSFTLHNMLNPDWKDRADMLAEMKKLMSHNDLVAVSFYPFMAMLGGRMDECLAWLRREFDAFKKPYVVSECGQPAEPVVLKSLGFTIPASPESQYRALERLLLFAGRHQVEFLIWYLPRDYDRLWEKIRAGAPEFFGVWRDCGLLDGDGRKRPAYQLWRTYFELPLCHE